MAEYLAITRDGEVDTKEEVKVEETDQIEKKRILSIGYIDDQLKQIDDNLIRLQAKKVELEAVRVLVDVEASKVVLKI